jgi:hypothetical protein
MSCNFEMKTRIKPRRKCAAQAACTVSAAALMLGVSHAATIGFNFQTHYCSLESYSGATVTAPAFGVGTNNWESLTQMDTGYGCDPGPFSLSETIDSTTSTNGLHSLPFGSLKVNWSGYVANVSGFGGYDRSPPHYTFGGNGHNPGEEEVYWGFIRDGVNFGPGQSGGDNNQPGYSVEVIGLKSIFTNSPFVVQLIASSDSLSSLTNAFVIDATTSTTQSVTYPNIPPIANVGDTAWPRGIGGGLSTASGSLQTDHLQIVGNRAQHSEGPPAFNNASTIAGFIVTDQPVITMAPQPVLASPGDTVTLRALAIGVPPLALHWQKDGADLAGQTNSSITLSNVTIANAGRYTLAAQNSYGAATSKVSVVTVDHLTIASQPVTLDSKPTGTKDDAVPSGTVWAASNSDAANVTRTGVMQFLAAQGSQIRLGSNTNFDAAQGTITFWMRSSGVVTNSGNEGAMLVDQRTSSGAVIVQHDDGTLFFQTAPSSKNALSSNAKVSDDHWHHIAVVYDQSDTGTVSIYVDGLIDASQANNGAWSWPTGQEVELGKSHDTYWRGFNGYLDDFRIYNRVLTDTEVGSIAHGDAVVDASALQVQLNFDAAPSAGVTINWLSPTAVLQSATSVLGPFTDVSGASSPYSVRAASSATFFRYRDTHTPVTLLSNPYDM